MEVNGVFAGDNVGDGTTASFASSSLVGLVRVRHLDKLEKSAKSRAVSIRLGNGKDKAMAGDLLSCLSREKVAVGGCGWVFHHTSSPLARTILQQ